MLMGHNENWKEALDLYHNEVVHLRDDARKWRFKMSGVPSARQDRSAGVLWSNGEAYLQIKIKPRYIKNFPNLPESDQDDEIFLGVI